MLALSTEQRAALAGRAVMRRIFIWCDARDPVTGDPAPAGFWNDAHPVTLGSRTYHASGSIITVSSLGAKGDMTIPGLQVTLSGIDSAANNLVRGESVGQAPIEVHLGIFDVATKTIIGDLVPFFIGFVDDVDIQTPEAGGNSTITLTCESTSRALTKKGTATRSPGFSHARDAADDFYNYTAAQRTKPLYFGRKDPKPQGAYNGGRG
ncbi:MAG: hypothetical protein J0H17_22670 [Rhizobiales bacterium]|nr:hypothetical protein [Hyphomicrobiales bacterium]